MFVGSWELLPLDYLSTGELLTMCVVSIGVRELEAPKYKCETPIIGGLGAEPPAGSRGRVPGQGVRGRSLPEAETLLAFERSLTLTGRNTPQIAVQ